MTLQKNVPGHRYCWAKQSQNTHCDKVAPSTRCSQHSCQESERLTVNKPKAPSKHLCDSPVSRTGAIWKRKNGAHVSPPPAMPKLLIAHLTKLIKSLFSKVELQDLKKKKIFSWRQEKLFKKLFGEIHQKDFPKMSSHEVRGRNEVTQAPGKLQSSAAAREALRLARTWYSVSFFHCHSDLFYLFHMRLRLRVLPVCGPCANGT